MPAETVSRDSRHVTVSQVGQRKKRNGKRRLASRKPLSARLVLDHRIKGDIGVLSDDLALDLFPHLNLRGSENIPDLLYVAVTPWIPRLSAVDDLCWTIIPIRIQSSEKSKTTAATISHSTVHFPATGNSIQSFLQVLQTVDPSRNSLLAHRGIEIYLLDVAPLHLDTIYVTVQKNLLRDLDDVQSRFGGGYNGANGMSTKGKGKGNPAIPERLKKRSSREPQPEREERLMTAVRGAISAQKVLHQGDIISLPLPSHPITHSPPPPAKISFCEPVSQGFLAPTTKIVLIQAKSQQQSRIAKDFGSPKPSFLNQVNEDDTEDTNEQFYSAAEEKPIESGTDFECTTPPEESETEASVHSSSEMSDDSLDDMISLAAPELPQQSSGMMSVLSSATPRPGAKRFDVHTPGSVMSSFTSGTARQGRYGGKIFRVECLLDRLSNEILHPKPRDDDDSEAFIFVDVHTLVKIGCFSGDWVRIESSEEPQRNMLASLKFGSLDVMGENGEPENWRVARVYGISGLSPPKIRYSINHDRRPSISHMPPHSLTPIVLAPPILLHNLQDPKYLKLSPLVGHGPQQPHNNIVTKAGSSQLSRHASKSPPVAKEVTLAKISTPFSMDRALQPALFGALKRHFETKRRLVKSGDIVGISVDEGLGKIIYSATKAPDAANLDDELTAQLGYSLDNGRDMSGESKKIGVAWFRVSHVTIPNGETEDLLEQEQWGGVAIIDCMNTRMVQAGSEISPVPRTLGNTWEYWLGVKSLPRSNTEARARGLLVEAPKPHVSQTQRRVRELIAAATSPRAIQLGMNPVVILLVSTQRNIGKTTLARNACADIGLHTFAVDAYDILAEGGANGGDVKTEAYLKVRADKAFACGSDCTALLIQHIEVLTADRMVNAMKEIVADARVIIATTTDVEKVPEGIRSMFTHEFELTAPEEKEREGILQNAVADLSVRTSADVDLSSVAVKTAALVAGDLVDVVERAVTARALRLEKLAETASMTSSESKPTVIDVQISGGDAAQCVTRADFDAAVDAARKNFADSIGAPKIPNVTWDDVGGLTNVKDAVMETIQLPLERPELFAKGMKKRSGILFYGPPGTGKTLLAKAIATEFSLNFFSVKGPELLNMYIGESEANVRRVFQRARDARPCVVFFDELDSVAPKRGNQGDSGGVMDRIVSQLLAELDGMSGGDENGGGVFVIGATNRPDLLDAALLRPGRFDKMLYLGVSDTHAKQTTILEALTRKFALDPSVSLKRIAERLPFTYTGADLYALCSDAMLKAITHQASAVDGKIQTLPGGPVSTAYFFDHYATPDDIAVVVTEEDFVAAQLELVPSVSAKELEHFERVRRTFESVDTAKKSDKQRGKLALRNGSANSVNGTIDVSSDQISSKMPAVTEENEDEYIFTTDHLKSPAEDKH